ncbi:MAG TPA: hypothetical protein DDZ41_03910, partial [Flavobacterium sp.]|nr:hypothetical protein [Flavobacterium sp.]
MQNKQAVLLIEKIQKEILQNKFQVLSIVEDLKNVRQLTMEENNPVLTKSLRLVYEHLEKNNAFLIEIPKDDFSEDDTESNYKTYSEEH